MQGQHSAQGSFFGMIYEELIPADHLLCKLAATVANLTLIANWLDSEGSGDGFWRRFRHSLFAQISTGAFLAILPAIVHRRSAIATI